MELLLATKKYKLNWKRIEWMRENPKVIALGYLSAM